MLKHEMLALRDALTFMHLSPAIHRWACHGCDNLWQNCTPNFNHLYYHVFKIQGMHYMVYIAMNIPPGKDMNSRTVTALNLLSAEISLDHMYM